LEGFHWESQQSPDKTASACRAVAFGEGGSPDMPSKKLALPNERIDNLIREIRGQKVILDSDLARVYCVPTKAFNQAVKRNRARFPEDFMFQLNKEKTEALLASRSQNVTASGPKKHLRSQFVTSKSRGGTRYCPYALTEHGAIMAANVLNSPQGRYR
jgi:hypothetical protein